MHPFEGLRVLPGQVGIHWFGQSSFALKDSSNIVIQVDPYFLRDRPAEKFIHPNPPLNESDLNTDCVLLTHDHSDHTCIESLQRIHAAFPDNRFYGPVETIRRLEESGIPPAVAKIVAAGDVFAVTPTITAYALWAKPAHGAPEDGIPSPDVQHLGYVVDMNGIRVYISGDPINTFAEHDELIQPIAELRPQIGLLTTHPSEGEFPYFDGSAKMARRIGLEAAIPAHYDCFVKRTYDPQDWASHFAGDLPRRIVIPYNEAIVFPDP